MKKYFLILTLLCLSTPAHACKCTPDSNGELATKTLADPSISVADVTVRGFNMANHQSMLQIENVRHGGLVARDIRAKFGSTSCAISPTQKKMTLLIKAEDDATYSIVGDCAHSAVINSLKGE